MPKHTDLNNILIIGAGPIIIGQACEFDYSGATLLNQKTHFVELTAQHFQAKVFHLSP